MAYFCDQLQLHIIPHGVYQLLHYLSRFADEAGGSIFPAIDRMAWETDRSRNTINHQLSALRRSGVLEVVRDGTRTRPTEYRINLDALPVRPKYDPTRRLPKSTNDNCRFRQQDRLTTAEIGNDNCRFRHTIS
jgi:DNA-binding transcriptional ArsR family regulator